MFLRSCCFLMLCAALPAVRALDEMPLVNPEAPFAKKAAPGVKAKPVFDAKGRRIVFGSKVLQMFPSGVVRLTDSGRIISRIYFYSNTQYSDWLTNDSLEERYPKTYGRRIGVESITADGKSRTLTVRGKVPFHKKGSPELVRDYTFTVKLLDSGKTAFRLEYEPPAEDKKGFMAVFCTTPTAKGYACGGKEQEFPKKWEMLSRKFTSAQVFTENPWDRFELDFGRTRKNFICIVPKGSFHVGAETENGGRKAVKFELDLLNWDGEAASGPVDLQKIDRLDPEYPGSRNLVHNPYFARGRTYIGGYYRLHWLGTEYYQLSDKNPKFGEHCLAVKVHPLTMLDAALVSASPGTYTVSFYARADKIAHLHVLLTGHGTLDNDAVRQQFNNLPKEWKRFKMQIKIDKVRAIKVRFVASSHVKDAVVYLDGIQVERGADATGFDASPVTGRLLTSAPDDFIRKGDPIDARIRLSTLRKQVSGKVKITVLDFFDTVLAEKQADFNFGVDEHPEIPLELDGKIPDGVHRVKAEFEADGKKYTEYSRFSVMPFFSNRHKLKNFLSIRYSGMPLLWDVYPGLENYIRRCTYLGVGADVHHPYPSPKLDELCRKYNFEILDSTLGSRLRAETGRLQRYFPGCKPEPGHIYYYMAFWHDYDQFQDQCKGGLVLDHRLSGGWTPEFRKKVVETAAYIVRQSSPRRVYIFGSEMPEEVKNDPHYPDLVLAVREGVKKVYPQSMFAEGGPANMYVGSGIHEIDTTLARLKGRMPIEAINCHTYLFDIRELEHNFKALTDMVEKKHGLKNVKYFFCEGMHYGPYQIPEWGIECINWDDRGWNSGSVISYDMGWTEKRNSAWFMRSWLVFLTRPDDVVTVNSSMANRKTGFGMDCQLRPRAFQKVPNTISMLLGNVKRFVRDVSFYPDTKCLIWEDEFGRPVAAVWNQDPAIDQGLVQAPWATANLPEGTEIFDIMGVKRTMKGNRFPVSPFPFFLRGKAGETEALARALTYAEIEGSKRIPFRTNVELASPQEAKLTFFNQTARPVSASVALGGKKYPVDLPALGSNSITVPLAAKVPYRRIGDLKIDYTAEYAGSSRPLSESFAALAVKKFAGDWNKIPAFPMVSAKKGDRPSPGDFSARAQLAWDKENLHVRVTVRDNRFVHEQYSTDEYRYDNDSLQVFIDTRCSARRKQLKTFDEDDYAYNIFPSADGRSARVYRLRSPDGQLTLGTAAPKDKTFADDIPCKFTRTADGYIYEVTLPARYLLPARLEKNYCMGLALFLNDRDKPVAGYVEHGGGGKNVVHWLTSTPEGTSPYDRPHLYPQILLADEPGTQK